MDMLTISLNENREYVIRKHDTLSDDDAFFILKRLVFDLEQKRLAKQVAGEITPEQQNTAELIRKRLSDRKQDL
jgi:hypothetical protein